MITHTDRRLLHIFLAIILPVLSSPIFAADYAAGLNMEVEASHNDNIRLVQSDKTAVRKYDAAPTLTFSATTEVSEFRLDSIFDFNRYDKSEFDSDDQNIALALSHQFETSSLGLNAVYIRNSTTTSELLNSGIIGTKAERAELYQLSPRWLYNINETNLLQVQASYAKQNYSSDAYTGYGNAGAQISWIHIINERIKWVTSATYSDYESDDRVFNVPGNNFNVPNSNLTLPTGYFGQQSYALRTKNRGLNVGLDYKWSEQSSIEARLGRSKNSTKYPVTDLNNICSNPEYHSLSLNLLAQQISPEAIGATCTPIPDFENYSSTADITWEWGNERQQFSLTGSKETEPTSNGYAVDSIRIFSNWKYQLTELDQISASLTFLRHRAIDDKSALQNASVADRNYGSGLLSYERKISEYWSLRTSYQYTEQKYTQHDNEASSNILSLSINYHPQQWHWSR